MLEAWAAGKTGIETVIAARDAVWEKVKELNPPHVRAAIDVAATITFGHAVDSAAGAAECWTTNHLLRRRTKRAVREQLCDVVRFVIDPFQKGSP